MTPWQTLQRRFSATRLLRRAEDVETLRAGGRVMEWVVPRAQCLFFTLDVAKVPAKRHESYAALAVKRMAPFAAPDWHAITRRGQMMVWAWPKAVLEVASDGGPTWSTGDRAIPEAILRGEPGEDDAQLVACDAGFDARLWRRGLLVASQWFPQVPDAAAWVEFLRGAGADAHDAVPMPTAGGWRESPWSAPSRAAFAVDGWRHFGRSAVLLAASIVVALLAWPMGSGLRHAVEATLVEGRIEALSEQLSSVLDRRDAALGALDETHALLALRARQPQSRLLAALERALGPQGIHAREWDFQRGSRLRLVLSAPGADPQALVTALMSTGMLDDVRVEPGNEAGQMVVQAELTAGAVP
ncbi:MAG: hypothetical protein ACK5VV_13760 [Lysobacteraceae bacterium]